MNSFAVEFYQAIEILKAESIRILERIT